MNLEILTNYSPPKDIGGGTHPFTSREWEVIDLIAKGKEHRQIGIALGISYLTVNHHVTNILRKSAVDCVQQVAFHLATNGRYDQPESLEEYKAFLAVNRLSPAQRRLLDLMTEDYLTAVQNKELAHILHVSQQTIKNHLIAIFVILDVANRVQAGVLYIRARRNAAFSDSPTIPERKNEGFS